MKHTRGDYFIYVMAVFLIIAGGWLAAFVPVNHPQAPMLINIGVLMIILRLARKSLLKRKGIVQDERTIKVSAYAYSYSWLATFALIGLLPALYEFGAIPSIPLNQAAFIFMVFMLASYILARYLIGRKMDL